VASPYEYGNEPSGAVNDGEFVDNRAGRTVLHMVS
jgi:hypothetical protein